MTEQKIENGVQSPHSGLRTSFKPSVLKTLQALNGTSNRFEGNKVNVNHQTQSATSGGYRVKTTDELTTDRTHLALKQSEGKIGHTHKKFSAQFQPGSIPPPRNLKEDALNLKMHDNTITKTEPPLLNKKQQLRTTFTANTFASKPFDKGALRMTTHTPIQLLESKTEQQKERQSPKPQIISPNAYTFKKPLFEKRPETMIGEIIPKTQQVKSPISVHQKRSPVVCGFQLDRILGAGKFGQVHLARHVTTGFICALKKIVKSKAKQLNMINQIVQEIKLHAFISNPNIVALYGWVNDADNIYLILEYMEGGTLFDYMANTEKLSELETVGFVREITQGVKYLHDMNIAHRDIKPQNIVLSYGVAKLCDFGWSARVQGSRKTYCGTFDYAPPEILQRKQYDLSVDLWCLGVLTYELMTGKVPFQHEQRKIVMQKIVNVDKDRIEYPANMSAVARDFIQNLVKKNPNDRMKSYKLLNHPFLDRDKKKSEN